MKRIITLIMLVLPCVLAVAAEPATAEVAAETNAFFATPLGDTIVPLIIASLCYVLYRLVKGEAHEDAAEA